MLMCDVDFFKQYNDTLGHQGGDHVLEAVAGAIKSSVRHSDEPFRYGGEEIVVLLPTQDIEGAVITGQRVCQTIQALAIPHPKGIDGKVSISVGVTACSRTNPAASWREILEQADQALYQAKKTGRNKVVAYQPEMVATGS
jgi:diguanylate cyclase (GGDEF)-like protein